VAAGVIYRDAHEALARREAILEAELAELEALERTSRERAGALRAELDELRRALALVAGRGPNRKTDVTASGRARPWKWLATVTAATAVTAAIATGTVWLRRTPTPRTTNSGPTFDDSRFVRCPGRDATRKSHADAIVAAFGHPPETTTTSAPAPVAAPIDLARAIRPRGPHAYDVDAAAFSALLDNGLWGVATVTSERVGETKYPRVCRIKEGSALHRLGLRSGDRLEALDDYDLGDPQPSLEAFAHVTCRDAVRLRITRRGTKTKPSDGELRIVLVWYLR
jgi:hypothetical protein